jgi:hypothetical protein
MLGPSLGEIDYLRGWRDDFLGDSLAGQYTTTISGAGDVTLMDDIHGGVCRIRGTTAVGNYALFWLGNNADGYSTLGADPGWVQLWYGYIGSTADIRHRMGAKDVANNNLIWFGANTVVGGNWILQVRSGGGAWETYDSGIPIDTGCHWFAMEAYPTTNRKVDVYMDGNLIAYVDSANVPATIVTPFIFCETRVAGSKAFYCDTWAVIPRA